MSIRKVCKSCGSKTEFFKEIPIQHTKKSIVVCGWCIRRQHNIEFGLNSWTAVETLKKLSLEFVLKKDTPGEESKK